MIESYEIYERYQQISVHLNERARRLWVASEAQAIGYGGISHASEATGISRRAITEGMAELRSSTALPPDRIRKPGGGPKTLQQRHPGIKEHLESLVEPLTRGDPEPPLRWTCKSTRLLAEEMSRAGWSLSDRSVAMLLHELKYSLQGNQKTLEGNQHPDRNAQFEYINASVKESMAIEQPVISVDTKKKELVGNYANNGKKWEKQGQAVKVNGHDFPDSSVPRAYPYGVYDLNKNKGFVLAPRSCEPGSAGSAPKRVLI